MLFYIVPLDSLLVIILEATLIYYRKRWVGPLSVEQHSLLFIYKELLQKLPMYLTTLVKVTKIEYSTRAQDWIVLEVPRAVSDLGRLLLVFNAPQMWNMLQRRLRLECLAPFREFTALVGDAPCKDWVDFFRIMFCSLVLYWYFYCAGLIWKRELVSIWTLINLNNSPLCC